LSARRASGPTPPSSGVVPNGSFAANTPDGVLLGDLDGSHREVLVPAPVSGDLELAWAPSAQEIAVAPSGASRQINLVSLNGATMPIAWPPGGAGDPYWPVFSPDGQYLFFSDVRDGAPVGIRRIRRDGPGLEIVASGLDYRPTLSPDGTLLAYHTVSQATWTFAVQVYDLMARTIRAEFPGAFPEWGPPGAAADLAMVDESTSRVVLIRSDGVNRR